MELILEIITIEDIVKFCIILFFSFIGSIAKDYLKILRYTNKSKFNFIEIFLSMITASITVFAFESYIESFTSIKGVITASFITGLIGFELLTRISSIHGLFKFIGSLIDLYKNAYNNIDPKNNKDENDDISES